MGIDETSSEAGGTRELELRSAAQESAAPSPRKIDLRDARAIRRELANVYRDMRRGRIETSAGTRLAYVLDLIRKAYDAGVLQERLAAVERTLAGRREREKALVQPGRKGGGFGSKPWTTGAP